MQTMHHHIDIIKKSMGALLVMTGLLCLTGPMNDLGDLLLDAFPTLRQLEARPDD